MRIAPVALRCVVVLSLLAFFASAQDKKPKPTEKQAPRPQRAADPIVKALDKNRDRTISAEEWKAASAALLTLDRNRDGKLSRAECGTQPRGILSSLDKDGDGRVSKAEASAVLKTRFDKLDRNGDGYLDVDEQAALLVAGKNRGGGAGAPPADKKKSGRKERRYGGPVMRALDTDGDQQLSAAEIKNAPAALIALDRNKDGKLSEDEILPPPPPSAAGFAFIARFDKNGDGKVSREEAPGPIAKRFAEVDSNGDGFIDDKEFEKFRKQRHPREPGK